MREILFRGKRIGNGKWVSGSLFTRTTNCYIFPLPVATEAHKAEVDPATVGQYTGLTDKSGKKIFEGDIVHITERGMTANGVVIFENGYPGGWLVGGRLGNSKCSLALRNDVEIIGNIHDNPELLEGGTHER